MKWSLRRHQWLQEDAAYCVSPQSHQGQHDWLRMAHESQAGLFPTTSSLSISTGNARGWTPDAGATHSVWFKELFITILAVGLVQWNWHCPWAFFPSPLFCCGPLWRYFPGFIIFNHCSCFSTDVTNSSGLRCFTYLPLLSILAVRPGCFRTGLIYSFLHRCAVS